MRRKFYESKLSESSDLQAAKIFTNNYLPSALYKFVREYDNSSNSYSYSDIRVFK